ncbi:hypothetical protein Tco_1326507 [Tanacetum coccineum]
MTNQHMRDFDAYKTYLAYATGAASPKMKRKLKKHASPSKKRNLVTEEEEEPEPTKKVVSSKKPTTKRQSGGVRIRDTSGVFVSKKKTPAKAERSKGIELLSDVGADSESDVPNELKGKSIDTSEGNGLKPRVPHVSTADSSEKADDKQTEPDNPDEEKETHDDEYVHTPDDYVPTDDETNEEYKEFDKEEYEELYGDVNISLKDSKHVDKEKVDEEMNVTGQVNVNQEGAGNQVNDDAQATQKTKVPIPSSSISSDYAAKYLNFDNIPPVDTKVVSMLDINVQHEAPRTSPLLTIPVSVIPEHIVSNPPEIVTTVLSTTICSLLSSLFPHLQQITPIPTPTTTKATTSTTVVPDSETLSTFHQIIIELEKDVNELKTIDHSAALLSTIKFEVLNAAKEYLETSLDDALYKGLKIHDADIFKEHSVPAKIVERLRQQYVPEKSTEDIRKIKMEHARKQQVSKETITSSDTTTLEEFDQKTTLFETMTNSKSFNKSHKQRALYHALLELILENEDDIDADRGLKRQKTSKDSKPSKKAKSTKSSKGTSKSQPKYTSKFAQAEETVFEAGDTQESQDQGQDMGVADDQPKVKATSKNGCKIAKAEKPPLSFDELMSTPINFSEHVMNNLKIYNLTKDILVGPSFNLLKRTCKSRKEYPFNLSKPITLIMERGRQVVDVDFFFNNDLEYLKGGSSSKKYTTSTTKTKAAKYDIPGIEDMVPSLWSLVKVAYDRYVVWGITQWGPKRQRFYGFASNRVSKHDVYSKKRIIAVTKVKVIKWYDYGYLEEIEVRREDQKLYKFKEGDFSNMNMHDIEDMSDISNGTPYTAYNNPQGIIYQDKYKRNRLIHSDELYKFSDETLTSARDVLHDIASNLRMDYLSKRRWSDLDKKRSNIMIKSIDMLLYKRSQNQRDLLRDIPLVRIEVLRYDIKGVKQEKGIMSTKTGLALEQTQQGRNRVNTYAIRNTKLLSGIEDSHHGPSDAMHNPP